MVEVLKVGTLTGHSGSIYALARGSKPNMFFSGGADGQVAMWNLETPEEGKLIARLPNSVYALHHLNDQNQLLIGQNFEGIHLVDYVSKKEVSSLRLTSASIFDLLVVGNKIFVATGTGEVVVVDLEAFREVMRFKFSQQSARSIAFNAYKNELAIGYSDNFVRIVDLKDLNLKQEFHAHTNSVFCVNYSPDGHFLLTGSRDAHLKVWDVEEQYRLERDIVAHMYTINHLEFSPDGKHFVTCSMDKSIKVWDGADFRLLKVIDKARHAGHGTSVNKLAWTSFNNQLVSASDDRTISIWNIFFKL
ncbi:MAG TPA: WD40 repeat domain-containing protein [Cyclobacteriaceae bacterium]|nr:WD40 repeat domain-containing protein [Cyclobacteriaceae bacterium]